MGDCEPCILCGNCSECQYAPVGCIFIYSRSLEQIKNDMDIQIAKLNLDKEQRLFVEEVLENVLPKWNHDASVFTVGGTRALAKEAILYRFNKQIFTDKLLLKQINALKAAFEKSITDNP